MDHPPPPFRFKPTRLPPEDLPPWLASVLILSIFIPVAVIRGPLRRMLLGHAYLMHLYGVALGCLGLVIGDMTFQYSVVLDALEGDHNSQAMLIANGIFFLIITELFYPFAAFATMCWGAAPEPWSTSYTRSLTRWYQLTPFHAGVSLVLVAIASIIPDSGPELGGILLFAVISVSGSFILMWTTLRGLAVHHHPAGWPASCRWPIDCDACGYPLVTQTFGQDCPECGQSFEASTQRAGLSWMPLPTLMFYGLFRPRRLGKLLITRSPNTEHHRAMLSGMAVLYATPIVATLIFIIIMSVLNFDAMTWISIEELLIGLFIAAIFSAFATTWCVAGGLLAGSLLGTFYRLVFKRNILHLAGQAVGFRSPLLLMWMVCSSVILFMMFGIALSIAFSGQSTPYWMVSIPFLAVISQFFFAGLFALLLLPVLRGTRHANV